MSGETELIGGVERRTIEVVPYDPSWPAAFAREHARIATAMGARAQRIDHVGSTSVPGLAAKPIIDVQVSVADPEDEDAYLPALVSTGYELRVREPGHRMFRTPARDVHVHVCEAGSDWERRTLLFRDRLRADTGDRERYAAVKLRLAEREWPDMNAYAFAKTPIVEEILARAEAAASSPI